MPETSRTLGDLETMLFLRRVPLFEGLAPEDLQRIAMTRRSNASIRPVRRSSAKATSGEELVVIVEGSVRVVHVDPDGTERLRPAIRAGRPHRRARRPPRGAAGRDGHRRSATGSAASSSRAPALKAILRERPDAAMAMLATLAERLSSQ